MANRAGFSFDSAVANKNTEAKPDKVNNRHKSHKLISDEGKRKSFWFTASDLMLLADLKKKRVLARGDNVTEGEVIREALAALAEKDKNA